MKVIISAFACRRIIVNQKDIYFVMLPRLVTSGSCKLDISR